MTCASCVCRVEMAIAKVPGVMSASVNLATETAAVGFNGPMKTQEVMAAIQGAGYEVGTEVSEIGIEGMTCASCVRRVELAIAAVPGVVKASVNLATERATVETVAGTPSTAIDAAIRQAGYEPSRQTAAATDGDARRSKGPGTTELETGLVDSGSPDASHLRSRNGVSPYSGDASLASDCRRTTTSLYSLLRSGDHRPVRSRVAVL